jgi:glycosyltransferase involved in cell wall biosynthesis
VAVVVTCHDYGRYLRQCLDSILAQTVRPETIVLVDDASSDDTPVIASEYAQRSVRYLRVEYRDVARGRNAGAAMCGKAAFLLFVDADNILPPNYLEVLRVGMTSQAIGVTYCHLEAFDDSGRQLGRSPAVRPFDLASLRRQNLADTCSLVRRQTLEQVGGWKPNPWGLHDWDLWLRITSAGWQMRLCPGAALRYRVHPGAMTDMRRGKHECGAHVIAHSTLTAVVTLFSGRGSNGPWKTST